MAPTNSPSNKPDVLTMTQDVTTEHPPIEETERKIKENKELIQSEATKYNEKYAKRPWYREAFDVDRRPFENAVSINLDYPNASIAGIDAILDTPYEFEGRTRKLRTHIPEPERSRQRSDLLKIRQLLEDYKKLTEKETGESSYFLNRNSVRVTEMIDQKIDVEKQPKYQELSNDYDQVFGMLSGKDKDFRRFSEKPDGSIDTHRARENKQLFFSILYWETDGFKNNFILSKFADGNSTIDIEKNKKNYPFIYQEWIKDKFDADKKEEARKTVADMTANLGLTNPDNAIGDVSILFTELNTNMTRSGLPPFPNSMSAIPSGEHNTNYYHAVEEAFNEFKNDINLRIGQLNSTPAMAQVVERLQNAKDEVLPRYIELVKAQEKLTYYVYTEKEVDRKFTKEELMKDKQFVLELAMKQFAKAMENVDSPYAPGDIDFGTNLHPRVRRMLIATMYYEGLGMYSPKTKTSVDDVSKHYTWALSKLIQSKYFNPSLKERFLTPEHREFLYMARYANLALFNIQYFKEDVIGKLETDVVPRLEKNLQLTPRTPETADEIARDLSEIRKHNKAVITESNAVSEAKKTIEEKKKEVASLEQFYKEAEALMANPDRVKIRDFIERVKSSTVLGSVMNQKAAEDFAKYIESVDLNYNMFDFKEKSTGNYLERMGIHPESIYNAYLEYWKKNPEMKMDQWDHHLRDAEGTRKLLTMFDKIIPPSTVFKGKQEFLRVFATCHGINPSATKPEIRDDQAVAIVIYTKLKEEIKHRELKEAADKAGNTAAMEQLDGMTFGDRITDYAKGVTDMLIGPGQSIANRAAGAAILFAFYKIAYKAIKGTGRGATGLRLLFMAGAAELALKHLTGEGLLDKLRLEGIADKLNGTYEDVLLDRAKERFDQLEYNGESITITDHSKALLELRRSNVPMAKVINWYKATKEDGSPKATREEVKLPIDYSAIVSGRMDKDPEGRGRFILKKTIENFFIYVSNKDQKAGNNAATGMNILEEVWVKPVQDRNFDLTKAKYADRGLPSEELAALRQNPNSVTWQRVIQAEIRDSDIDEVQERKATKRMTDRITGAYTSLRTWSRTDIEDKIGEGAKEFWSNVDSRYAPAIGKFLESMSDGIGRNLQYGARRIELEWNDKKVEIYKFGRDHWGATVDTVSLLFEIPYAADQWIVPWFGKMLKQTKEIIRTDKLVTIPNNRDLEIGDVMSEKKYEEFTVGTDTVKQRESYELLDESINPNVSYFGIYQIPFYGAMQQKLAGEEAYYESGKSKFADINKLGGNPNVGYYISEVNQKNTPGIKPTDSIENRMLAMNIASREQAKEVFKSKGVEEDDIDRYMRPIHVVIKNPDPKMEGPNKLYVFWRMPLKGSTELTLIKEGRFPDYIDPEKRKFRPPFEIDPSKGIIENLKRAYGVDSPFLRKGGHVATIAIAQWLHVVLGMIEKGGKIARFGLELATASKVTPDKYNLIEDLTRRDEKTLQWIDEYLGSAGFMPLSDFYKNPKNYAIYNQALKEARNRSEILNLETKPDGTDWVWDKIQINTGRKNAAGALIYMVPDPTNPEKLIESDKPDPKTSALGRLNTDMYKKLPNIPTPPTTPPAKKRPKKP